jgi:hypothetical protein
MQLTMRTHGCLTKTYEQIREQGFMNRSRISEDQVVWADIQPTEGNGDQDPNTYKVVLDIPGAQFKTEQMVDVRKADIFRGMAQDRRQ